MPASPQFDVAVVGSANMDLVSRVARLPRPGETVPGLEYREIPGGKGANQAIAAARMGARVSFCGSLGLDPFGEALAAGLDNEGIDNRLVNRDPIEPTGVAMIWVEESGQNEIVVVPGANGMAENFQVDQAVTEAKLALFQLEIPVEVVVNGLRTAAGLTMFDPAPAINLPPDFPWERVGLVTPNETEAEALVGIRPLDAGSCAAAASSLRSRGVATVVITLGGRGCYWMNESGEGFVPPYPVFSVDATAAGDAFNGVLAARLAEGDSLQDALRWASAAGALTVSRTGAQPSIPTAMEVRALLESG